MGPRHRHDPLKNLVGFCVGDVNYAVPILCVKEVSNPLDVVSLPHAPSSVCGVSDYRGDVVPVIDMRQRFKLEKQPNTRRTKWVILDLDGRLVALVVDRVSEVFGTAGTEVRPSPGLGGGEDVRGIAGVTSYNGELVFVLDTNKLRDLTDSIMVPPSLPATVARASLLAPKMPA
jgi:purine-binding chemotaxis protein CheW